MKGFAFSTATRRVVAAKQQPASRCPSFQATLALLDPILRAPMCQSPVVRPEKVLIDTACHGRLPGARTEIHRMKRSASSSWLVSSIAAVGLACAAMFVGCGSRPDGLSYNNPPIEPTSNTPPPPNAKLATPSGPSTASAPPGPHVGSIADLRRFPKRPAGIEVTLSSVIVTGANGNGRTFYVADAEGGEFSGIEIEKCKSTDDSCSKTDRPVPGQVFDIQGKLFTGNSRNPEHWSIGPAGEVKLTRKEVPRGYVSPYPVTLDLLADKAANTAFRGAYVYLADTMGRPLTVDVTNTTPSELRNSNWQGDLNQCGENLKVTDPTTVNCCANGPLFFGFYVAKGEATLRVATDNYRQANITAFPCFPSKVPFAVRVGDKIGQFAGVFDRDDNANVLFPTSDSDYIIRPE